MKSQIEAYEKGLEQLHAEVRRLELIIEQKNRIITSLRRQVIILEEINRDRTEEVYTYIPSGRGDNPGH